MKKTISSLIILLMFLVPALGNASYLIRLKNGGQLATPAYWTEGKWIFFYCPGGIAGMERKEVDRINRDETYATEDHPNAVSGQIEKKESPLPIPRAEKSPAPGTAPEVKEAEKESPEKLGENSAKKRLQEELRTLEAESSAAWEKYRKASEDNYTSKAERDEARNRVSEIDLKKQKVNMILQGNNQK